MPELYSCLQSLSKQHLYCRFARVSGSRANFSRYGPESRRAIVRLYITVKVHLKAIEMCALGAANEWQETVCY